MDSIARLTRDSEKFKIAIYTNSAGVFQGQTLYFRYALVRRNPCSSISAYFPLYNQILAISYLIQDYDKTGLKLFIG
jgi:hypothetical protein